MPRENNPSDCGRGAAERMPRREWFERLARAAAGAALAAVTFRLAGRGGSDPAAECRRCPLLTRCTLPQARRARSSLK